MKKFRKLTAVIIAMAMLLLCLPAFAAAKTPIIDHNFDAVSDIAAVKALGWNLKGTSTLVRDGGNGYISVGTTGYDDMWYKEFSPRLSDVYNFDFDIKVGESTANIYFHNSDGKVQYILRGEADGFTTGSGDDKKVIISKPDFTKWYSVKCKLDFTNAKYDIALYDGETLAGEAADNNLFSGSTANLKWINLENGDKTGKEMLIDNVCLKEYEEPSPVDPADIPVINHTFAKQTSMDDVTALGWSFTRDNSTFVTDAEKDNYVSVGTNGKSDMSYAFSEALSGTYEFSFDFKAAGAAYMFVQTSGGMTNVLRRDGSQIKSAGNVYASGIDFDKWYAAKFILKLDSSEYSIEVFDETGSSVGDKTEYTLTSGNLTDLIFSQPTDSAGNELLIDNVYLKTYKATEPDPQPGETTILDEPFESYTSFEDMQANGWTTSASTNKVAHVLFGTHAESDNITGQYLVQECGSLARSFDNKSSGTYKIIYWLKAGAKNNTNVYVSGNDKAGGKNSPMILTAVYGDTLVTKSYREANGGIKLINIDRNEWYRVENIVNLDSGKITTSVYDKNGKLLKKNKLNELYSYTTESTLTSINAFHMDNNYWPSDKDNFYFDDLRIESYVNKPTLTMDDVTVTDYKDEAQSDLAAVCPAVKTVELDFGAGVTAESAALITITPSVSFSGTVSGDKYVMAFNELLANNTQYTITVPGDIANASGDTLGAEVTITLKTTTVSTDIQLAALTDESGTPITTLAGLAGKKVYVGTNAVNSDSEAVKLTYIMAFYKGNYLSNVQIADGKSLAAGSFGIQPTEFTVGDMTDVTAVKVMLWNGLGTMVPWTDCIEINR